MCAWQAPNNYEMCEKRLMARTNTPAGQAGKKSKRSKAGKINSGESPRAIPNPKYKGVCSTCDHAEFCAFRRDTTVAVLACDDYKNHVEAPKQNHSDSGANSSESAKGIKRQYRGLCVNCHIRETCQLHPEGESVWHCEGYI